VIRNARLRGRDSLGCSETACNARAARPSANEGIDVFGFLLLPVGILRADAFDLRRGILDVEAFFWQTRCAVPAELEGCAAIFIIVIRDLDLMSGRQRSGYVAC